MRLLKYLFLPENQRFEGVRPIKIYLLRGLYFLIASMMATQAWGMVFSHEGDWEPYRAMSVSVWAAYGTLSAIGVFKPLKMLPIVVFMIFYKTLWLFIVALPLWRAGRLAGSGAEDLSAIFVAAPFMLAIVPWRYVVENYFLPSPRRGSYRSF